MAASENGVETTTPFGDGVDKHDAGEAFGEEKDGSDGDKIGIGGVGFDENEIADDGD